LDKSKEYKLWDENTFSLNLTIAWPCVLPNFAYFCIIFQNHLCHHDSPNSFNKKLNFPKPQNNRHKVHIHKKKSTIIIEGQQQWV
jgi:hypothetical protein